MKYAVLLLCFLLCGCASTDPDQPHLLFRENAGDFEMVAAKTKVVPDPHAGWIEIKGPGIVSSLSPRRLYSLKIRMDFRKDRKSDLFQLQVHADFPRRVFLTEAYADGRKLKMKVLDRERVCEQDCVTVERIGIVLSEAELADYATRGFAFEILGRRDEVVLQVPAAYLAAVRHVYLRERE